MIKCLLTVTLLSLAFISFAGCALVHPTDPYVVSVSEQSQTLFSPKSDSSALPDSPVTLKEAIRIALENNPDVAMARHEIKAAGARHDQAFARALPKVDVIGGYTHEMDNQRLMQPRYNGEPGVFGDDIFSANIVLSQPIFTGGRLINEIKATKLLRQAATHQLARTRKALIFNVSSIFYAILSQREVITSLVFSQKTLNEHLKRINDLIAQKKAARVDRLRTEVRIADIDQQLTQAKNILSVENRVMANLMGISDEKRSITLTGKLARESESPGNLDNRIKAAFKHRTDYMAARAVLEAHAKKVDAASAEHWPSISLQGTYGERWAENPSESPPGTDESEDIGQIGIFVNLPVFEGGNIAARVHEERANLATSQDKLRSLELSIRLDVETAWLNIDTAQKRINTTEKAIAQAKETLRIERMKYDQGKGSITDVLDAQSAMLNSQTNYYRALADYNTALAQMDLATGEVK